MQKPKFSIVIALAPWRDAEILKYLKRQSFSKKNYEIIIKKGTNVPINRNLGVSKAKGDIIIFLDDDGIIDKDFLENVDSFFKNHPDIDILGGPQLTPKSDKLFGRLNGYALSSNWGAPIIARRYSKGALTLNANSNFITGALLIVKKKVFKSLDFDEKIYPRDDVEFVDKAKKLGFRIAWSPEVYIYHRRRPDLASLVKQIYGYAKSRALDKLKFSNLLFGIPLLFILYVIFLPILISLNIIFSIPILLYLVLTVFFTTKISLKNKDPSAFFLLPFIFVFIHITYGLGFLYGLVSKVFNA